MIGVVKMVEMAVVLASEGSDSLDRVKELESEKATLVAKSCKLKAALERSEEMFREQFDVLSGEKERADKALEEKDCLQLDKERLDNDNQQLSREVEDLKAILLPAEDEPEGMADLRTHSNFIARIQLLESDCVGALADGFEFAVNQLSVLNSGLNIEGTRVLSQVVDGRVVPPLDSPDVDVGTPGSD
ncbi:unnamed protein product [Vicia faba]|uniref:Uncharacterized protein n=1 Tax=Vicia faba TaxID=3906 RepID=A0AAV0ZZK0_VICFA|nr:unnamed protein product [Vicia faba]